MAFADLYKKYKGTGKKYKPKDTDEFVGIFKDIGEFAKTHKSKLIDLNWIDITGLTFMPSLYRNIIMDKLPEGYKIDISKWDFRNIISSEDLFINMAKYTHNFEDTVSNANFKKLTKAYNFLSVNDINKPMKVNLPSVKSLDTMFAYTNINAPITIVADSATTYHEVLFDRATINSPVTIQAPNLRNIDTYGLPTIIMSPEAALPTMGSLYKNFVSPENVKVYQEFNQLISELNNVLRGHLYPSKPAKSIEVRLENDTVGMSLHSILNEPASALDDTIQQITNEYPESKDTLLKFVDFVKQNECFYDLQPGKEEGTVEIALPKDVQFPDNLSSEDRSRLEIALTVSPEFSHMFMPTLIAYGKIVDNRLDTTPFEKFLDINESEEIRKGVKNLINYNILSPVHFAALSKKGYHRLLRLAIDC